MAFSDMLANLDASINQGIAQRGKTIDQMGVFQQNQRQLYQQDTGKILDMLQNYNNANANKEQLAQEQKNRLAAITAEYDRIAMNAQSQREADAINKEKDRQLSLELQKMADEQAAAKRATDVRIAAAQSGGSSKQSDLMDTFMSRVTPVMLRGGYIDPATQAFDWKGANADAKSLRNLFQTGLQDLPQDEQNKLMNIFDAYLNGQAPDTTPAAGEKPRSAGGKRPLVLPPGKVPRALSNAAKPIASGGYGEVAKPFVAAGEKLGQAISGKAAPAAVTKLELPVWDKIQKLIQIGRQGGIDRATLSELQKYKSELEGSTGLINRIGETIKPKTVSNLNDIASAVDDILRRYQGSKTQSKPSYNTSVGVDASRIRM